MSSSPFPLLSRTLMPQLVLIFGSGLLAYSLASSIARERYETSFVVPLLLLLTLAVLRKWRLSVYLLLSYVLLEGFVVNYFAGRPEINALKDVQLVAVFTGLIITLANRRVSPIPWRNWTLFFFAFAFVYCLAALNPRLPTLLMGAVGIRVTLLMFLVLAISFWFFRTRGDVLAFFRFQTLASIPIALFGIVQYFTGPSMLLTISPGFQRAVYHVYNDEGMFFRTISTFASTGGFSHYLWVTIVLTLGLHNVSQDRRYRWICKIAIVLQLFAVVTTGGRAPIVFGVFTLMLAHFLVRRLFNGIFALFGFALILLVAMAMLGPVTSQRFESAYDLEVNRERNIPLVVGQLMEAMKSPPEGFGAGIATSAANRLAGGHATIGTENQFARIWYESGILGIVLFAVFVFLLAVDLIHVSMRVHRPQLKVLAGFAASVPLTSIAIFPAGLPLDIPPINFYFWFAIGLVYGIARINALEQAEALRAQAR